MGLSEGILWDFHSDKLSEDVLEYYNIDRKLIPEILTLLVIREQYQTM